MAKLKSAKCKCELPCSCIEYENKIYPGLESIIDDLEERRDDLLSYVEMLEKRTENPEG